MHGIAFADTACMAGRTSLVTSSWAGARAGLLAGKVTRPAGSELALSGIMIERKRVTLPSRMQRFVQDLIECHGVRMTAASCNARVHGLQTN